MIKQIPLWLTPYVIGQANLTYAGEIYTYAIISAEFSTGKYAPANFVIFKDGVLAISDAYPKEYRELGLIHEIIEPTRDHDDGECLYALKQELEMAEQEEGVNLRKYISFRLAFFNDWVTYYGQKERSPKESFLLRKLEVSYNHLLSLVEAPTK
ncbi:MAG: hypothetical protein WCQ00_03635 [bacterium]